MYDSLNKINSLEDITLVQEHLNVQKVSMNPTEFLPLNANIDGQMRSDKHKYKENRYITKDQARHIYKKVESGNIININTPKQEIDQDCELSRLDDKTEKLTLTEN